MATGIVSVGLHMVGHRVLSLALLAGAAALWLLLMGSLAAGLTHRLRLRRGGRAEAMIPGPTPDLTAVAATTVLGTRLSLLGWQPVSVALLVLAAVLWPFLLVAAVRGWQRRMRGAVFLSCVATQGLAVLSGTLASAGVAEWLARAALVPLCLGLLLYVAALTRFDPGQLRTGQGDQWIAGGALAITELAASKLVDSPVWTGGGAYEALRTGTLIVLVLDLVWYAVLVYSELHWPRPGFSMRRWSTVFPLGMTGAACLSSGSAMGLPAVSTLGMVLVWIGVAAWLFTLLGALGARTVARR